MTQSTTTTALAAVAALGTPCAGGRVDDDAAPPDERSRPRVGERDLRSRFGDAWRDPRNTTFAAPPRRLESIAVGPGVALRPDAWVIWGAEVAKAHDPVAALPEVFSASRTWGHGRPVLGVETFVRVSSQRGWLDDAHVTVIERVWVDHRVRRVLYEGIASAVDPAGTAVRASPSQPLFLVEHRVDDDPEGPSIGWRIVHRTEHPRPELVERARTLTRQAGVPGYVRRAVDRLVGRTVSPPQRSVADAHETLASDIQWTRPFGPAGPELASLWGDPLQGAHGSMLRFAPGSTSGMHHHPFDSWGIVLRGELVHTYEGAPPGRVMGAGSWYFEPAGIVHESACGSSEACVVFVYNPGRFGFVPHRAERVAP